jgi:hypothetical protein
MSGWSSVAAVVENLAPTIASVIGGPLAGSGVSALEKLFGLTPAPTASTDDRLTAVAAAVTGATPEQLAAMRKADQDYAVAMAQAGFKDVETLASLNVQDRSSARQMQVSTKSLMAPLLAILIIVASICFMGAVLFHAVTLGDPATAQMIGNIQGYLFAECKSVLAFYFGSSQSNDRQSELLAKSIPAPGAQQ